MPQSYRDKLVRYVCCHRRCSVIEAERYLNQSCPDWVRSDPPTWVKSDPPVATLITVEKEIDDECESEES